MTMFEAASLTDELLVVKGAAMPAASQTPQVRRARPADGRVRVALRLDEDRRRRLKLASIHLRKSTQAMLLAALDYYFERVVPNLVDKGCTCLGAANTSESACVTLPLRQR
jgi:hypothetical protein